MYKPQFTFKYDNKKINSIDLEFNTSGKKSIAKIDDNLSVVLTSKEMPKHNAIEWFLTFENNGSENSKIVSEINDCDIVYNYTSKITGSGYRPTSENIRLIRMNGMVDNSNYANNDRICATEYAFVDEYFMKHSSYSYHNRSGRSSDEYMPFFHIEDGGKKGIFLMIGWSGSWNASFTEEDGNIHITSGMMNAKFFVKPGEKLRTTATIILEYEGNYDNLVRRLISDEYTPEKRKNDSHGLFAFGLWGGLKSEEMVRRVDLLTNNGINYEQLWIDAGWYGNCTNCEDCFVGDWNNYTGDYSVNLNVHPDRFASVIAAGEKNGMDFMLWFDSEHATNVVPVSIEHPEWMLGYKNDVYKPYNIINFGNEDAWDYVFDMLCSYINEMNIKVYRQDCNADMDVFFAWNDEPDRDGVSEIKHITGMYRLWDSLLEKYPDLIIDNCASGGRRVDMEAIKRSTILCRSDYCCLYNQNPEVLQACTSNSATYFPHIGSFFSFVDRSPSRYAVRSSYNETWASSALQVSSQSSLTTEELRIMKETNDEYCSIREYFDKDFYNHGSKEYDSSSWAIWQYHDPNKNSGIIMAFRRKESPSPYAVIDLKGINDNVVISYRSLDNGTTLEGNRTITLELPEKESALIYEYIVK